MGGEDRKVKRVNISLQCRHDGGNTGGELVFGVTGHKEGLYEVNIKQELESKILGKRLIGQSCVVVKDGLDYLGRGGQEGGVGEGGGVACVYLRCQG